MTFTQRTEGDKTTVWFSGMERCGGLGRCTTGGVAGYVHELPGGVLVTSMTQKPLRVFLDGHVAEGIEFIKRRIRSAHR